MLCFQLFFIVPNKRITFADKQRKQSFCFLTLSHTTTKVTTLALGRKKNFFHPPKKANLKPSLFVKEQKFYSFFLLFIYVKQTGLRSKFLFFFLKRKDLRVWNKKKTSKPILLKFILLFFFFFAFCQLLPRLDKQKQK